MWVDNMLYKFSSLFLVFMIYSFLGYVLEVIGCSWTAKKFVNRGFFCGPYCPIYGVGSLFILYLLLRYESDPIIVFVFGILITGCIEYITSFLLEKIFHNKWWDYSSYKYHINGRVCLVNCIWFGIGSLAIIYLVQPCIRKIITFLGEGWSIRIALILLVIFFIDAVYSMLVAYNLRNRIIIAEELKSEKLMKIPGMLEKAIKDRLGKFKTFPKRLLVSFPNLKNINPKAFDAMEKVKKKKTKKNKKKK